MIFYNTPPNDLNSARYRELYLSPDSDSTHRVCFQIYKHHSNATLCSGFIIGSGKVNHISNSETIHGLQVGASTAYSDLMSMGCGLLNLCARGEVGSKHRKITLCGS